MRIRIFKSVIIGALLYILYIQPVMISSTEWDAARITLVAIVACVVGFFAGVLYERSA